MARFAALYFHKKTILGRRWLLGLAGSVAEGNRFVEIKRTE